MENISMGECNTILSAYNTMYSYYAIKGIVSL